MDALLESHSNVESWHRTLIPSRGLTSMSTKGRVRFNGRYPSIAAHCCPPSSAASVSQVGKEYRKSRASTNEQAWESRSRRVVCGLHDQKECATHPKSSLKLHGVSAESDNIQHLLATSSGCEISSFPGNITTVYAGRLGLFRY